MDIEAVNAHALAYVRRESLDLYNRLHSILDDIRFVGEVHKAYSHFPILPNLRCGAWYVDPAIATREGAYFKSTDGHFGNWSFNLRRPNLHLLPLVQSRQGMVIVDSTRAGKRIPDALSKTVPIWCAVINRAMFLTHPDKMDWDTEIYCPPGVVSEQERVQIQDQLDRWAASLVNSSYVLPALARPLRPIWITPATSVYPRLPPRDLGYFPVICVSASKQVHDGVERRLNGFSYVQGSGDDHELWGMGLTPDLFWEHKHLLLRGAREELPAVVEAVVARSKAPRTCETWKALPTPVAATHGRLLIGKAGDMPSVLAPSIPGIDDTVSFVVISASNSLLSEPEPEPEVPSGYGIVSAESARGDGHVLALALAEGKKGQMDFLQTVLPLSTAYIKARLARGDTVCVCCDSGKDASVGIVLAVLARLFDEKGNPLVPERDGVTQPSITLDKRSIRRRLEWIIASRPEANPSRVTLKRVNEFLLSSPTLRRKVHMKYVECA